MADVERHFVHMTAQDVTTVVGWLLPAWPRAGRGARQILLSAPVTAREEVNVGEASPAELFHRIGRVSAARRGPVRVNSSYAYGGSLNHAGCAQDVCRSALADGSHVSKHA